MLLCRAYLDPSRCTYQDIFLKEAYEDVGKMGATLDAAPAAMHMSILMQARPAIPVPTVSHTPRLQIATPY